MMNMRLYIWLMPWAAPPILDLCHRDGEQHNEHISQYRGKLKNVHCRVLFKAFPFPAICRPMLHRDVLWGPDHRGGGRHMYLGIEHWQIS
jgi:hypothetical protein